jgi:hypothetical protein
VVLAERPVILAVTVVALLPVTGEGVAVTVFTPDERSFTVLYSNITAVLVPFAFTAPFKVAPVVVTAVAALVVAVGAAPDAVVVKLIMPPSVVPPAFVPLSL